VGGGGAGTGGERDRRGPPRRAAGPGRSTGPMRRGPRRRGRAAELPLLLMPMGVPCALVFLASSDRIAERLGNPSSVWARLAGALPCALFLFVFTGLLVHALRADRRR